MSQKIKKKKFKAGKIKRHQFKQAIFKDKGFGKTITTPTTTFRVEMNWLNPDGNETDFQVHWINCRKFTGRERKDLLTYYKSTGDEWTDKETLESKFACVYVSKFLAETKDFWHLNQAFIYPTTKIGNETIREPIYIVRSSKNLEQELVGNTGLDLVLKNSIDHIYNNRIIKISS